MVTRTNKGKQILLSKCVLCYDKNSRFINQQENRGFRNNNNTNSK